MSVVLPLFAEGNEIVRLGGVDVTFVPLVRVWTRALPWFDRARVPCAFPRHPAIARGGTIPQGWRRGWGGRSRDFRPLRGSNSFLLFLILLVSENVSGVSDVP